MKPEFYSTDDWLRIVHEVAPEAFLTGSRAFGTSRDPMPNQDDPCKTASDTDVAVLISCAGSVKERLSRLFPLSCEDSSYNNGFKYSTIHGTLNIVSLHPLDFVCWKLTTKHLREIVAICPDAKSRISVRETKLGIFEALTGIHKMLIPYNGSDKSKELSKRIPL